MFDGTQILNLNVKEILLRKNNLIALKFLLKYKNLWNVKNKELQVFECKSIKKKIMSASNTYHFGVFYFKASAKCYKQFEWKELSKAAIQRCSYEKVF